MKKLLITILMLCITITTFAAQQVIWNKVPIKFTIPVGKERMLTFAQKVIFNNTNPQLTTDKVSILNDNGTLYFTAKKAFKPLRIVVNLQLSGQAVLLDINAVKNSQNADDTPMKIILPHDKSLDHLHLATVRQANYLTLMRYAIQYFFAPANLAANNDNITKITKVSLSKQNRGETILIKQYNIIVQPLAAWRSGDLYITAFLLKNTCYSCTKQIKLADIIGHWLAASFYPTDYLTASGLAHSHTMLFLISYTPFNEVLKNA